MTPRAFDSLVAAAIRIGLLVALAIMLMAENAQAQQPAGAPPLAANLPAQDKTSAPSLNEEALRARLVGKTVFLRGFYVGEGLQFDEEGNVEGSPAITSFTLSALEIRKVQLSKKKLEIEADRYGLHFIGALPYEDAGSKPYDKVKISKKPVRIIIAREQVVIPKAKKGKGKGKDNAKPPVPSGAGSNSKPSLSPVDIAAAPQASASPATAPGPATPGIGSTSHEPKTTTSPAHSAMLMNAAIDKVFATDIDQQMMSRLPDFWQEYFKSKNEHREFMPADKSIRPVSEGMTSPKVLNSIDPSSNEFAQKYGIAGLTLFRTVVDASGKPQQIAIARPIGFGLDEKAVDAIKNSHFTPAMQNGHPVPVVIDIVVTFRIYSNRTKPGSVPKGSKTTSTVASAWDSPSPHALQ